jgi:orotidine-5'-phosphate decarboxylase
MTSFSDRMRKASEKKNSRLIVALDPAPGKSNPKQFAIRIIDAVADSACAIKVNFHLLLPLAAKEVMQVTKRAHRRGLQCIADIKLNDIGNTNEVALIHLKKMGFDAVIANPFMGTATLASLVQKSHEVGAGVIALVYMSHQDAGEGYGIDTPQGRLYKSFLERAAKAGADGIVVGATQLDILKEVAYEKRSRGIMLPVYSPGVGVQGGDARAAVESGADYLIVGRSIVESKDPAKSAEKIRSSAG